MSGAYEQHAEQAEIELASVVLVERPDQKRPVADLVKIFIYGSSSVYASMAIFWAVQGKWKIAMLAGGTSLLVFVFGGFPRSR
ncbi:hypothetical protein ACRYCC_10475 [Actinomadura scrupuli]|uniref:hypothetical protein n=1 Tax=Actinomadura scrupuli TaxID=559629 RepID=UPI003D999835